MRIILTHFPNSKIFKDLTTIIYEIVKENSFYVSICIETDIMKMTK